MHKRIELPVKVIKKLSQRSFGFIKKHPLSTILSLFLLVMVGIVAGEYLRRQQVVTQETQQPAQLVSIFQIGKAPRIQVIGKVSKENVIQIQAQTGGVINKIMVEEGDLVKAGTSLAYISSNYQGGNALSLQRQIAQKQYQNVKNSYDLQKDLLTKQREIAEKTDQNADELRTINEQSLADTKSQIALSEEILESLDSTLAELSATESTDVTEASILQTKQLKNSLLAGLNQLRASVRATEYSVAGDQPPAQLSDLQKEVVIKQLEVQEKALELSKEVAYLQLKLTQVNESLAYPAVPFMASIERVHVRKGQLVNPGTPLFTVKGKGEQVTVTVLTTQDIAQHLSTAEASYLSIDSEQLNLVPVFISSEAVEGSLYAIKYVLPDSVAAKVTNGGSMTVSLPISRSDSGSTIPFVPIDAVHQTSESSVVYVVENGVARPRIVELGTVYGQFVTVLSGLADSDQVIIDRTVIDGTPVTVEQS